MIMVFILKAKCHDNIKISLSLYLVVRGCHIGGVISWGHHDQFPSTTMVMMERRKVCGEGFLAL